MGTIAPQQCRLKTGEHVVVRAAVPDDALALLNHVRAVIAEGEFVVTCPEEFNLTEEQERDWIRQYRDDPGKLVIVAEESGQVLGVLNAEVRPRKRLAHRATLHIAVDREWRERGVGTALLQTAIDWATAHPVIEQLCLAVFATNVRAIGLYRKFGFVDEGRQGQEVKFAPGHYVDNLLMYRFVTGPNAERQ